MEFTFDFCWKDHMKKEGSFRTDRAETVQTSRVCFTGIVGAENQVPGELHRDMESVEKSDFDRTKFTKDTNGWLRGRAVITTIGVYPYIKKDGSVSWELRHPDDVYEWDSLKTLELLPLTNDHPAERVTSENIKDLQVGQFGEFVMVDPRYGQVMNTVVVSDASAISDVEGGKRALSMGYSCDVVPEEGVWNGVPYTARQKNIRYNHGSIVQRGRAGDAAMMKFDSFDGIQTVPESQVIPSVKEDDNTVEEVTMGDENMKIVKLDGVDYKAESAVITALHKATEKADSIETFKKDIADLTSKLAEAEGQRDSFKEKMDALQKQVDTSIKMDELESLFQKRKKLDEAVELAKIEGADKMDAKAKMEAVVVAVSPSAKESLEARKDSDSYMVYLESRFDSAVESIKADGATLLDNLRKGTGAGESSQTEHADESEIKTDEAYWESLRDASKKKAV